MLNYVKKIILQIYIICEKNEKMIQQFWKYALKYTHLTY